MKNLTVIQFLNVLGLFTFTVLALMFGGFYLMSKASISPDSDFTLTLLSLSFVFTVISVVFVILTVRSFIYPYNGRVEEPTASFEELFEKTDLVK